MTRTTVITKRGKEFIVPVRRHADRLSKKPVGVTQFTKAANKAARRARRANAAIAKAQATS